MILQGGRRGGGRYFGFNIFGFYKTKGVLIFFFFKLTDIQILRFKLQLQESQKTYLLLNAVHKRIGEGVKKVDFIGDISYIRGGAVVKLFNPILILHSEFLHLDM